MPEIICNEVSESDVHHYIQMLPEEQILHSSHVGKYVGVFAEIIRSRGLYQKISEAKQCELFGGAAYYHDIGKAQVPWSILLKPGKLTEDELHIIREHPLYAKKLFDLMDTGAIAGIPQHIFQLARQSAVYHHEWWNGMGYPYGLSHEEIPFIARITSICDVYDAITSNRAYRKAHSHEFACHEIEVNAGIQFDPALAKVFLLNSTLFINERQLLDFDQKAIDMT